MSILTAEPSIHPEALLEERWLEETADDVQRRWWVLYTKARQEKAVARQLYAHGVPFYLPLVKKRAVYRGRQVISHLPLFPGYVFLCGSEAERLVSLTTNRISRVLDVPDPARLRSDLWQLEQLISANAPLTMESRLVPGARVRVRYGALEGLEGVVMTRKGQTRLLVVVDFLQQGASVEIDDYLLEQLD